MYFSNCPYVFYDLCSSVWILMQVGQRGKRQSEFLQKLKIISLGWKAQCLGL